MVDVEWDEGVRCNWVGGPKTVNFSRASRNAATAVSKRASCMNEKHKRIFQAKPVIH